MNDQQIKEAGCWMTLMLVIAICNLVCAIVFCYQISVLRHAVESIAVPAHHAASGT